MTREQFEQGYAERSKLTVEQLRELGCEAVPCDCSDPTCCGWRMKSQPDPEERTDDSG